MDQVESFGSEVDLSHKPWLAGFRNLRWTLLTLFRAKASSGLPLAAVGPPVSYVFNFSKKHKGIVKSRVFLKSVQWENHIMKPHSPRLSLQIYKANGN